MHGSRIRFALEDPPTTTGKLSAAQDRHAVRYADQISRLGNDRAPMARITQPCAANGGEQRIGVASGGRMENERVFLATGEMLCAMF